MGPARWAGLMWAGLNMCIACELAGRHRTAARPASTPGSAQAGVEPATVVIFSSGWHCHCAELIITKCILLCEAAAAAWLRTPAASCNQHTKSMPGGATLRWCVCACAGVVCVLLWYICVLVWGHRGSRAPLQLAPPWCACAWQWCAPARGAAGTAAVPRVLPNLSPRVTAH